MPASEGSDRRKKIANAHGIQFIVAVHPCLCLLCLLTCKKVRAGLPCCLIILGAMFCPQCSGAAILVQVESLNRWGATWWKFQVDRKSMKTILLCLPTSTYIYIYLPWSSNEDLWRLISKQATPNRTVESIHDKAQCSHAEPFRHSSPSMPQVSDRLRDTVGRSWRLQYGFLRSSHWATSLTLS